MYKTMSENGWHVQGCQTMKRKESGRDGKRFSVAPIPTPAGRGPHQPTRKIKRCKIGKIEFLQITKTEKQKLKTLDFTNLASRVARCASHPTSASYAPAI